MKMDECLTLRTRTSSPIRPSPAGHPEARRGRPLPQQVGLLHGRDSVHGAVLRLEDDGVAGGQRGGDGHHLQQQAAHRVAVLQQREPRPARRHHQAAGGEASTLRLFVSSITLKKHTHV